MGVFAAGSYDELADTVRRVSATFWILGRKSLIVVIVSADHNVCARIIKGLPQRLESGIVAVCRARTKEGFMKVSQGAGSMIAGRDPRAATAIAEKRHRTLPRVRIHYSKR